MNKTIPWCEKYRPSDLNDIVLSENNKLFFNNILEKNIFPNLLLYGPPGTGKTTTIINLINSYQKKFYTIDKTQIIHLNASDDRGIDIIRNNINTFVKTNNLFNNGIKFIILDEVDYMTKSAQIALKYLINSNQNNVCFCLICNYISKIEKSLQNIFCKIKFNALPYENIYNFINNININENLNLNESYIKSIIIYYNYDIRSMINFIQSNKNNKNILNDILFNNLFNEHIKPNNLNNFIKLIENTENKYKISKTILIKKYIYYFLINKMFTNKIFQNFEIKKELSNNMKFLLHFIEDNNNIIKFLYLIIQKYIK